MALLSGFGPFKWFEETVMIMGNYGNTLLELCNGTEPQSTLKSAIRNAFLVDNLIIMLRMIFSFLHWEEKMHC